MRGAGNFRTGKTLHLSVNLITCALEFSHFKIYYCTAVKIEAWTSVIREGGGESDISERVYSQRSSGNTQGF